MFLLCLQGNNGIWTHNLQKEKIRTEPQTYSAGVDLAGVRENVAGLLGRKRTDVRNTFEAIFLFFFYMFGN